MAIRFLAYAPRSKLSSPARKAEKKIQQKKKKIARKRPTKLRYSRNAHMSPRLTRAATRESFVHWQLWVRTFASWSLWLTV